MQPKKLIEILSTVSALKDNTRHSWTPKGRQESVAEHCWRLSLFAYFMKDEFPDADINKVMLMCIVHDIGEAFTGDIPSFLKSENDEIEEQNALLNWVNSLPFPYNEELTEIYNEIQQQNTVEAKLFNALDKLEAAVSHNEADISTWIELEYTLNPEYGFKESQFSPYLKSFKEQTKADSLKKIEDSKELS